MSGLAPPPSVLGAFGVTNAPAPLEGGQGSSWLVGDLVLKPLDVSELQLEWEAEALASILCDGFRIALPERATNGSLVVDGWCAWQRMEGRHAERRWQDIIAAGERFHAALVGVPRPEFIARRSDPWAIGDRVAWGEMATAGFARVKHLPRLVGALRVLDAPSQLIYGDLTGNVLFAAGLPPAIIDVSPYWRPAPFASAIVVADALVWEGADQGLLEAVGHIEHFDQFFLRALIYRVVTDRLTREHEPIRADAADPYLPAVELACRLSPSS